MAKYELTGPDGKTRIIEAPAGASKLDLIKRLQEQQRLDAQRARESVFEEMRRPPEDSYDILDEFEEFGKGIGRGAVNIGELAAKGVAEGLDADQETLDTITGVATAARSPFEVDAGPGGDTVIGGVLGEGLGSMVPLGIMSLFGPAGIAAAAATGAAAGAGEATSRARAAGATEEQIDEAFLPGLGIGATEAIPLGRILGRAGKQAVESILARYGKSFLEEGGQEAFAAAAQNLVEQQIYNPDADLVDIDVLKEAGVGGTVGIIAQGLADLALKGKRAPTADVVEDTALTPEQRAERAKQKQATLDAALPENFVGPMRTDMGPMRPTDEERQAAQDAKDEALNEQRRFQLGEGFQGPLQPQAGPDARLFERDQAAKQVREETKAWREKNKKNAKLAEQSKQARLDRRNEQSEQKLEDNLRALDLQQAKEAGAGFQGPLQPQAGAPTREQAQADQARRDKELEDALGQFQGPMLPAGGPQRLEDMLAEQQGKDRQLAEANAQFQGPTLPAQGPRQIPKAQADVQREATGLAQQQARALPAPDNMDPRQRAERKATDIRELARQRMMERTKQRPSVLGALGAQQQQQQRDVDTAQLEGGSRQQTMTGVGRQQPQPEAPEAKPATRNITAKRLDTAGVPPNAPIRKRITGKNLSDPEQLAYVREQLQGFVNNPSVSANAKAGVNRLINELNPKQPDLFETARRKPDARTKPTTPDDSGAGTSPIDMQSDTVVGRGVSDSANAPVSDPANRGGLGRGDGVPSGPRGRKNGSRRALEPQEPAVTPPPAEPAKPAPAAKAPAKKAKPLAKKAKAPTKKAKKAKSKEQSRIDTVREAATKIQAEAKREREIGFSIDERLSRPTPTQRRANEARDLDRKVREMNDEALREFFAAEAAKVEAETSKKANGEAERAKAFTDSDMWFERIVAEKGKKAFSGYDVDYTNAALNDPTSTADLFKIMALRLTPTVRQKGNLDEIKAARKIFDSKRRPIDAINTLGHMLVNKLSESDVNTSIAARAWMEQNLSPAAMKHLDNFVSYYTWLNNKNKDTVKKQKARKAREEKARQAQLDEDFSSAVRLHGVRYKETDADREADEITRGLAQLEDIAGIIGQASAKRDTQLGAVSETLHPDIIQMLHNGDLAGALNRLAETAPNRFIANVARKLAANVGVTKVRIVNGISNYVPRAVDSNGREVAGYYVATNTPDNRGDFTNTIFIDGGHADILTLLHEVTHAATVKEIATMRSTEAKQLRTLFNDLRDHPVLQDEYGIDGLSRDDYNSQEQYDTAQFLEFVAEAYANPAFQDKLAKAALEKQGKTFNGLDKFVQAVYNILRRLVGLDTVSELDPAKAQLAELVEAIMAPVPSRFNEAKNLPTGGMARTQRDPNAVAEQLSKDVSGNVYRDYTPSMRTKFMDKLDMLPRLARKALLYLQPLNAVANMAQKWPALGKIAKELDRLTREQSGALNNRNAQNEVVVKEVGKWKAKHGEQYGRLFNTLVYESTLAGVDPSYTLQHAQNKYRFKTGGKDANGEPLYAEDRERMDAWRAMQGAWNELKSVGGDKVYTTMRDRYGYYGREIEKLIGGHIDALAADPETGVVNTRLANQLRETIKKATRIEPYFPLERKGDYWVYFKDNKGEEYVEAFESKAQRAEAIAEIKANPELDSTSVSEYMRQQVVSMDRVPPTEFFLNVKKALEANKASPEVKREISELFLKAMPEQSFMRSFVKRKGTPGFNTDAFDVFGRKTATLGRQLTQMEYGAKLAKVQRDLEGLTGKDAPEEIKAAGDTVSDFVFSLRKSAQFARSPNVSRTSKFLTSLGFHMTLGLNASAAFINMSQLPMVVGPYLGAKYGIKDSFGAMGTATRLFVGSGRDRVIEVPQADGTVKKYNTKAFPGLDNHNWDEMAANARKNGDKQAEQLAKDMKVLVEVAGREGQLNRSIAYDILDLDTTEGMGNKINAISGWMFHHAERFNRQVGLATAYKLEVDKLRKGGVEPTPEQLAKAAQDAIDIIELTNGSAHAASAPRIAQNDVGRVAFLFKRYGVTMLYMLGHLAKNAVVGKDKALAARQLGYITAGSGVIAGVHGLPMFGLLGSLYDLFLAGEEDDDWDTMVRKATGELAFNGAGNALTGWSMGSRMGLSDLVFRDPYMNDDKLFMQSLVEQLGGPVLSLAFGANRGINKIADGEVLRGMEQILPAAIRNPIKTIRYANEGALTSRGDPIVEDFDPMELVGQLAGFAPSRYQLQSAINTRNAKVQKALSSRSSDLRKKLYIAMRFGDVAGYQEILDDIAEFNTDNPEARITYDSIKRSLRQHRKTTMAMRGGVTINPRYARMIAESDEDFSDNLTIWDML